MTDEQLLRRLEAHFDARLAEVSPPERLTARVMAIPDSYPVPALGRRSRWFGRPLGLAFAALLLLAATVAAALVGGAFREPPEPIPVHPGAAGLTAFGDAGLRLLDLNGVGGQFDCDGCEAAILDVAWAHDGRRVAVVLGCIGMCGDDLRAWGLRIVDTRTGTSELLVPGNGFGLIESEAPLNASFGAVDWSPNDDRLAYGRRGGGIFIRDMATGRTERLSDLDVDSISWSPDGMTLLVSTRGGSIALVPLDGSEATDLGSGSQPDWSPDGSQIAFRLPCELWVASADGTDRDRLAVFDRSTWGGGASTCEPKLRAIRSLGPVWSPNGSELAAVFANTLYRVSADGGEVTPVESPIERGMGGIGMGVEWTPMEAPR